ncbi:enterochelin esterase [Draconibacterium orientale]|uniref:Esterase n=1 Tax=Draconibacterium orientale TaxID=1168034 RepID=X5DTR4_9BACT|nr:esterase [Draconibacterium orientale]AHW58565.1 esterase [Draconibacterium orientale]SEU13219.1 enterochelin esterase [Draconibacterium orientale]
MKKTFLLVVASLAIMLGANAQELTNFMNREPIVSPEIGESQVTFRFLAPKADTVKITGGFTPTVKMKTLFGEMDVPGSLDLTKDEKGLWSITLPLPEPELYTYSFIVDGTTVNDPRNTFMQRDGSRYLSVLLVPGEKTENYFEAEKRGNLHQVWYDSPTLKINRRMFVYTPYGYENSNKSYPVLYLLHGGGGDEDAWTSMGRTRQILDNLIEKGLAEPMICVMPNGNPNQMAAQTTQLPVSDVDYRDPSNRNNYVHSIVKDIVPYIEKNYRVIADPDHRAIAGLSMGGGHTIAAANEYPGMFQYICPLSMGIRGEQPDIDEKLQGLKKAGYKLYWLACGNTDFLYESAQKLDAKLTENGLEHTFYVTEGGHTWANWRVYLNTFAPLLFK